MIIGVLGYSYLANRPINTPMVMTSKDSHPFPSGADAMVEPLELKANMVTQVVPSDQLSAGNQKMDALLLELKNTKARVARLKQSALDQERTLSQNTRKISALAEALEQERRNNEALENELLTKSAVIEELEEMRDKLTARYKEKIGKSNTEVDKLQGQLRDLNAQRAPAGSAPVIAERRNIPSTEEGTIPANAEQPNPADIIDWIIQKKSE
jgi:molybdopterin converting factor small subunit